MALTVAGMFDGIGAFGLGLERAGLKVTSHTEKDPACQRVLRKHWPDVPINEDVTTREWTEGEADVICAGFPCQDVSQAGPRTGLSGSRSGLFREVVRALCVVRPLYVLMENVEALLRRGMGTVLGEMAKSGYDAEWDCIPKAHVGAPDIRDRVWIVAQPQHPDADRQRPHPAQEHQHGSAQLRDQQVRFAGPMGAPLARSLARVGPAGGRGWRSEPGVRRVVARSPAVVDRLKQLGNSGCPRIPEAIGLAIVQHLTQPPSPDLQGRE